MAASASRKAILNYDILWHILSPHYISGHQQRDGARGGYLNDRDLARLAQASRAFFSPAVQLLWAKLESLWPLWRLLSTATLSHQDTLPAVSHLRRACIVSPIADRELS